MYSATEDQAIRVGALGVRFLVETGDSNGSASVFECYVPANSRMPAPHSHDAFEETIYGVVGVTSWTIDGECVEVVHEPAGDRGARGVARRSHRRPAARRARPARAQLAG